MTGDAALTALLRRFAALSRADRDFVFGLLGQAERERLQLALDGDDGPALSSGLASLVDRCRAGDRPANVTERAAHALLAALDAAAEGRAADRASPPQRRRHRGWGPSSRSGAPAA